MPVFRGRRDASPAGRLSANLRPFFVMIKKLIITSAVIAVLYAVFLPAYTTLQNKKQRNAEYLKEIRHLAEKNKQLEEEIRLLNEDPEYLEKVAREKMGLVKEGEVVYKIIPEEE